MNKKTLGDVLYKIRNAIPRIILFNADHDLFLALTHSAINKGITKETFDNTVDQYWSELLRDFEIALI